MVNFIGTYHLLDALAAKEELPVIDVEAVMSQIVDCLANPVLREQHWKRLDCLTGDIFGQADPEAFDFHYANVRRQLQLAIVRADFQLRAAQLYAYNRLPYDYVQRKHSGNALLRRQPVHAA